MEEKEEEHKIKNIKIINTQRIIINNDEFVKRKSFTTELEALYNHIHFVVNHSFININGDICFFCGKIYGREAKLLTQHHAIPVSLNSKYNVLIPVCEACHSDINKKIKRSIYG